MALELVITLVGFVVGLLQAVIILYLSSLKKDMENIWHRVNNHSHQLSCENDDCRSLMAGKVVIEGT